MNAPDSVWSSVRAPDSHTPAASVTGTTAPDPGHGPPEGTPQAATPSPAASTTAEALAAEWAAVERGEWQAPEPVRRILSAVSSYGVGCANVATDQARNRTARPEYTESYRFALAKREEVRTAVWALYDAHRESYATAANITSADVARLRYLAEVCTREFPKSAGSAGRIAATLPALLADRDALSVERAARRAAEQSLEWERGYYEATEVLLAKAREERDAERAARARDAQLLARTVAERDAARAELREARAALHEIGRHVGTPPGAPVTEAARIVAARAERGGAA